MTELELGGETVELDETTARRLVDLGWLEGSALTDDGRIRLRDLADLAIREMGRGAVLVLEAVEAGWEFEDAGIVAFSRNVVKRLVEASPEDLEGILDEVERERGGEVR